jgi:hypothetical protein
MWHLFYARFTERGCPPNRVNSTPPSYGALVAKSLKSSYEFVAANKAHGVFDDRCVNGIAALRPKAFFTKALPQ